MSSINALGVSPSFQPKYTQILQLIKPNDQPIHCVSTLALLRIKVPIIATIKPVQRQPSIFFVKSNLHFLFHNSDKLQHKHCILDNLDYSLYHNLHCLQRHGHHPISVLYHNANSSFLKLLPCFVQYIKPNTVNQRFYYCYLL